MRLDCLESGWSFYFSVDDELPDLLALSFDLHKILNFTDLSNSAIKPDIQLDPITQHCISINCQREGFCLKQAWTLHALDLQDFCSMD